MIKSMYELNTVNVTNTKPFLPFGEEVLLFFNSTLQGQKVPMIIHKLRKQDTEIFWKVSIYKKVLSVNKFHFLIHSVVVVKFIRSLQH